MFLIYFGMTIGALSGIPLAGITGFSGWVTIPLSLVIGGFLFGKLESFALNQKLKNMPPVSELISLIKPYQRRLTEWERDFVADIEAKIERTPDYLNTRATTKQINSLAQIYVERIRKVKLKGRSYKLTCVDNTTGEVREITIGEQ